MSCCCTRILGTLSLIEWFWSVEWDMPDGTTHDQQVLSYSAGNIGTIDDGAVPLDPGDLSGFPRVHVRRGRRDR